MNMSKSELTLEYRKAVLAPEKENDENNRVSATYVAAMNQNFNSIGFTMSERLMKQVMLCNFQSALSFYKDVYALLKDAAGDMGAASPIWPNFPEDVKAVDSKLELYLANIIHFLSYGAVKPEYNHALELPALMDFSKMVVIDLATEEDYIDILVQMILQNAPLSATDRVELVAALGDIEVRNAVEDKIRDQKIPQKETLAIMGALYLKNGEMPEFLARQFVNARDILRVLAVMSGYDASLSEEIRFASFPRKQRLILLDMLENLKTPEEDMVREREMWKRVGERLHPGEYRKVYPKAYNAFTVMRSNTPVQTYMGRMEKLLHDGKYLEAAKHMAQRPGLLGRYLDVLVRKQEAISPYGKEPSEIVDVFAKVAKQIDIRVLVSMFNHFANRDNELALTTGKSNGAASNVSQRTIEPISGDSVSRICSVISEAIKEQYKERKPAGKVYVGHDIDGLVMPSTLRNTKRALMTAVTGSRFKIEDDVNIIRGFLYWLKEDEPSHGVDLDLSVTMLHEDFTFADSIGYYNPSSKKYGAYSSGDVRQSGPDGGCEFLDFDLEKARKAGAAYAVYTVNSYTSERFSELDACFMGYMGRDGETGKTFEPKTVKNRFDLSSDARESVLFVVDIINREIIIADYAIKSALYSNAVSQRDVISMMAKYVAATQSVSVKQMVRYAAQAGYIELVDAPE